MPFLISRPCSKQASKQTVFTIINNNNTKLCFLKSACPVRGSQPAHPLIKLSFISSFFFRFFSSSRCPSSSSHFRKIVFFFVSVVTAWRMGHIFTTSSRSKPNQREAKTTPLPMVLCSNSSNTIKERPRQHDFPWSFFSFSWPPRALPLPALAGNVEARDHHEVGLAEVHPVLQTFRDKLQSLQVLQGVHLERLLEVNCGTGTTQVTSD